MPEASVLHADLDTFYVSMELLRHPELRGKPVIIAGGLGARGVVNTCSYEAREFGVHSAMPTGTARRLCPQGIFLPSDYSFYAPASKRFHEILRSYTPDWEPAGSDEAYLDVAGCERLFGSPEKIAKEIRARVKDDIGINVSIGVAVNKLVAKVASDAAKPDGLLVVPAGTEAAFFAPMPIRDLPMVGAKTEETLKGLGIKTIGDLAAFPPDILEERLGDHGHGLVARAQGIYSATVLSGRARRKSISSESTFSTDEGDGDRLHAILRSKSEHVAAQLARKHKAARTVTLKLRFPPFETLTRSLTGPRQVELADDIYQAALQLFETAWSANGRRPVRLIGVGVANLEDRARQLQLGETLEADRLAEAVGDLRERFGDEAVRRAAEVEHHTGRDR
jgi:DNA polymerase IV